MNKNTDKKEISYTYEELDHRHGKQNLTNICCLMTNAICMMLIVTLNALSATAGLAFLTFIALCVVIIQLAAVITQLISFFNFKRYCKEFEKRHED